MVDHPDQSAPACLALSGALTRRETLRLAGGIGAAGIAAALLPAGALAQTEGPLRRTIPSSGEELTAVGIGTAVVYDFDPETEKGKYAQRRKTWEAFFANGGSLIDTSPSYGESEIVCGRLLDDMDARSKAFVATKIRGRSADESRAQMAASFKRLGVAKIDLMQVHNLRNTKENLGLIGEARAEGRIRYTGVTHFRPQANDELAAVMKAEKLDFVQFQYSMAERSAEDVLLPLAADRGQAVLVNLPFGRGKLFRKARGAPLPGIAKEIGAENWPQFFLKYIISHPAVTCVIPGTDKPEYAIDNLKAATGEMPDAAMRKRMVEVWEKL